MLEPDYFANKRAELGMDRADSLVEIQAVLDSWYPKLAKAKLLHQGVLRIVTPNASVAGDLRMRQVELIARFPALSIKRLQIGIQSL